ncbi:hypothetical protein LP420_33200 [Massilia sp. B-10]|nr:hypothetical protein LP420_33200 [Massilia sp. B-10]
MITGRITPDAAMKMANAAFWQLESGRRGAGRYAYRADQRHAGAPGAHPRRQRAIDGSAWPARAYRPAPPTWSRCA